jgi:hypothetical protein
MFSIPSAEYGGPPDWSLANKIDDIEWSVAS